MGWVVVAVGEGGAVATVMGGSLEGVVMGVYWEATVSVMGWG